MQEKELIVSVKRALESMDCDKVYGSLSNLLQAYEKSTHRLDRITKLSDTQQLEMLKLNENLQYAYLELDDYKNHLEEKIAIATKDIRHLNEELARTQREVIITMGAVGESKSKETGNHVKRVAEYSKIFALHYGLKNDEIELLREVSPMHDIGKIAVPDHILNKPGKLNAEEMKIMREHAELGYEILDNSERELMKAAKIVAYEHHERWDGEGYPRGIKGENIHIYGRITAVADVFDALASDRCYKKAWNDEKIFKLLREESGRQFDPKLIEIFFSQIDEFLRIKRDLRDRR